MLQMRLVLSFCFAGLLLTSYGQQAAIQMPGPSIKPSPHQVAMQEEEKRICAERKADVLKTTLNLDGDLVDVPAYNADCANVTGKLQNAPAFDESHYVESCKAWKVFLIDLNANIKPEMVDARGDYDLYNKSCATTSGVLRKPALSASRKPRSSTHN